MNCAYEKSVVRAGKPECAMRGMVLEKTLEFRRNGMAVRNA
ncbi:hypothetical protein PPN31119_03323 [Pandoraea pnomenusa]|uniref:Uncharacterized protein n=1 Tax=Pandoraea pnomenusa TaxID=93220 RepID=A0A378YML8_9BURK|nr:Uncharacterised protein [Pandoraea pnomenusa]VVE69592.1 hypothetical protein PPN31119_03323 [Pandoraea pnomenusa]